MKERGFHDGGLSWCYAPAKQVLLTFFIVVFLVPFVVVSEMRCLDVDNSRLFEIFFY